VCCVCVCASDRKKKSMRACAYECALIVRVSVHVSGYGRVFVSGCLMVCVRVCM